MTLGPVRVIGAGVVVMPHAIEVCSYVDIYSHVCNFYITCLWFLTITFIVSCFSLTDPNNGSIDCLLGDDGVPSYEDTCNFTCDTGYELTGSDTRTCQSDGSWSGSDDVCVRGNLIGK